MKRAIYIRLVLLALIAVVVCGLISAFIFAFHVQQQTEEWLTALTVSAAKNYPDHQDARYLSEVSGGLRVTVIAVDGAVISDSVASAESMGNHSDRTEVKNASVGSVAVAVRKSDTMGVNFMYASTKLDDGVVIRLAYSYPGLLKSVFLQFPAAASAMAIALILALFLAGRFSNVVAAPLIKVADALSVRDYELLEEYSSSYQEVDKTIGSIRQLLQNIAVSNQNLLSEREKVRHILSEMAEGFIMISSDRNVLLCNESAKRFLRIDPDMDAVNILTRVWDDIWDEKILEAVNVAVKDRDSSSVQWSPRSGLYLRVFISPIEPSDSQSIDGGATIMLVDITSERELEQQKQDFFSNASHELKTPITSILGFSEMLGSGMITDEDEKKNIALRIEKESRRMSELIDDILMISNLESRIEPEERVPLDFSAVAREAADSILPIKDGELIEISLDLEPVYVSANRRQLRELCSNLVDNAVKYNKPGGSVDITLKKIGDKAVFTVSDTGFGIPRRYQARVFERFFRVDSNRDNKAGGTGLGLSIVKHLVNLYGGEISLKSKEGKGTSVEVRLEAIPHHQLR
ncbi:MAG: hypothetical protein LBK04_04010 [Clostridiales Family XIII bacterium]|jgi:two-component system phosphate regulon sensor histidine kinase PhoR|nr:hypothetical protein [Clostridiales Family XIII bacterium]